VLEISNYGSIVKESIDELGNLLLSEQKFLDQINERLVKLNQPQFCKDDPGNPLTGSIGEIVNIERFSGSDEAEMLASVERYIKTTMGVVDSVRGIEGEIKFSVKSQRELDKAARKDKWILWSQQLVRWCIGVVSAIILYSAIIYTSEDHCIGVSNEREFCIKVPVKDWFQR
jgi:hypothetical protein